MHSAPACMMSRADVIAKSPYTARVSLGRPHDADLAKSRNCELADQASAASVELLGRRAMTEAASQHTDCIGELTASLCKRSSTSPRCALLPGRTDCLNSSPSGYVCAPRVINPQAGQSARKDGNVATVIGPAGRPFDRDSPAVALGVE